MVLQLYPFACWKELLMIVGRSKVLVILYGGIVCYSRKWLFAIIRAIFLL